MTTPTKRLFKSCYNGVSRPPKEAWKTPTNLGLTYDTSGLDTRSPAMTRTRPFSSPASNSLGENLLTMNPRGQENYAYQQKVGSLLYTTTITRPNIARAAAKLSESLQNP